MQEELHKLKLELIEYKHQAHSWKARFEKVSSIRDKLQEELDKANAELKKLKSKLFGKKTEKRNPKKDPKDKSTKSRGQQPENKAPTRRNYDHLPTTTENYEFEKGCSCESCGKPFSQFGEPDESEIIEIEVMPYLRKVRRGKVKKSCQCNGGPQVMTAPGPEKLIPGGRIGISIWSEILIAKYQFGQPLHRTLNYYKSKDLDLATGTITGGLQHFCGLFQPVMDAIHEHCLKASFWHADETRWSVFEKLEGKESTRWYLWLFESSDAAVYIIDPTRATTVIDGFFNEDSAGTLMVDRYSAYQCYIKSNRSMHLAFCWAHIRREFLDFAKESPNFDKWTFKWVDKIRVLYNAFAISRSEKTTDSYAILKKTAKSMRRLLTKELKIKELSHGHKRLLNILHNNWVELTRFVEDSDLPIDNNEAERSLRTPVVGRKNFYGSGSIWSAKLAAQCYSIFKTLSMNKMNTHQWLVDYLGACAKAGGEAPKDLAPFLPWKNEIVIDKVLDEHDVV
jgi:transposase